MDPAATPLKFGQAGNGPAQNGHTARFPVARPRRLRLNPQLRSMVRETRLSPDDFIYPLFVAHGRGLKHEISAMPGVLQWSPDLLGREAQAIAALGIPAVLLFGLPESKDPIGLENFARDGIVQQATRAIKDAAPDLLVITDVCLCEYTDHGHCGLLNTGDGARKRERPHLPEGYVLNDETLEVLVKVALSHAEAGADMLMVKPALAYLDIIRQVRDRFPELPLAAYNVSGEYSMLKAAAANGWLDEKRTALEVLTGIKRAGADLIITYHAKDAAQWTA